MLYGNKDETAKSYKKGMHQIGIKETQDKARLGRKGDPLENVQEIKISPYK